MILQICKLFRFKLKFLRCFDPTNQMVKCDPRKGKYMVQIYYFIHDLGCLFVVSRRCGTKRRERSNCWD